MRKGDTNSFELVALFSIIRDGSTSIKDEVKSFAGVLGVKVSKEGCDVLNGVGSVDESGGMEDIVCI